MNTEDLDPTLLNPEPASDDLDDNDVSASADDTSAFDDDPGHTEEDEDDQPNDSDDPNQDPEAQQLNSLGDVLSKSGLSEQDLAKVTHKIKVAGKEEELPLSEIVQGYQRDGDYRQKTQVLASQRREVETHAQAVLQEKQQFARSQQSILQKLQSMVAGDMQSPEVLALAQSNPAEWQAYHARHSQGKEMLNKLMQEVGAEHQQSIAQQRQLHETVLVQEKARLQEALPEWSAERQTELRTYLEGVGFSAQDINAVYDHRLVVLLDKARRFDVAMKAQQTKHLPKARTPSMRSASRTAPRRGLTQLSQTGSIDDAANALANLL